MRRERAKNKSLHQTRRSFTTTWPVARQKKEGDDLSHSLKIVNKSSEVGHGGELSYDGLVQHPLYERGQIKSRDVRVYEGGPITHQTLNKEWGRSSSKEQKRTGVEEVRVAGLAVVGLNKIESLKDARALLLRRCRPV